MDYNNDFKYDLKIGQLAEGWFGNLLSSKSIEVKFDLGCYRTGNFYIEYESRGKPSGIATTEADFWFLVASTGMGAIRFRAGDSDIQPDDVLFSVLIPTKRLRELCRTKAHRKAVPGGDNNTSLGVLIKAELLNSLPLLS